MKQLFLEFLAKNHEILGLAAKFCDKMVQYQQILINFNLIKQVFMANKTNNKISEGVEVNVETFYQPDYSNPLSGEYMFAYRITIDNHNSFPVKLFRRHWHIFDSNGSYREVEGEGVVGIQPMLVPGRTLSICERLQSSYGIG